MKLEAIFGLAKMAYKMFLRELLVKAIEDPSSEWDDLVLAICDRIFDYEA